jgi:hypothetical protein
MKRVAAQPSVLFSDDIVQDGKVSPAHRGRAAHGSSAQGAMAGGDGVSLPSMRVGLRRGRALCQLPVTHFARSSHLPRRPPPQRRRQRGCRPELMSTVLRRSLSLACDDLAPCCRPPDLHRGNGRPHGWDLSPWARRPNVDTTSLSPPCLRFTRSAPSHSPAKRKTRTCCSHTVRIDPPTCSCRTIQPPALTVRAAAGPADRMRCHRTLQRGARPRNPPSKTGRRARRHRAAAVPAADHLTSFARRARGRAPGIEKGCGETARARPVFAEDSGKPHLSADQLSRTDASLSRRPGRYAALVPTKLCQGSRSSAPPTHTHAYLSSRSALHSDGRRPAPLGRATGARLMSSCRLHKKHRSAAQPRVRQCCFARRAAAAASSARRK